MGDRREVAARRKDGSEFPAEASIAKLTHAGRTTFTAILRDISERKRAETALRESERRLATLLANLSGMAYRCRNDPHWTMEYASEGCLALTGYPAADLVGNARVVFGDLIHPDDRQPLWEACQASLTARGACSQEYRIRAATGDEKWVWDQARGVYAESGELLAIEGFITDVTARKEAEAQLLAKTEQLHAMAEAAVSFLETGDWRGASACLLRGALRQTASEYGFAGVVVDDTLRILAHEGVAWDAGVNRDFYEAARRRYEEVGYLEFPSLENLFGCVVTTGRAVLSNDPAADPRSGGRLSPGHPPLRCFLGVPMLKGTAVVGMLGVANRPGGYTAADQAQLEVLAHMASVLYDNYRRSLRERSLQEELRQAQKMDAIGRLAGGIAHDFNNLLTVILGRSQVALRRLSPDDPLRRSIALIAETAERAGALVQQLLAFSRKQLTQPRVLVLTEVVTRLEQMLRRLIGEDVELVTTFAPDLGRVKADPSQLEQVLVNLAVNARDAMPTGGRLTIETENVQLDLAFARRHRGARPGPYVRLSVSDTGVGMDAVTRARIFEPFFTTKEPGKGTGLGLATVYGIVKQSDGYIAVDSEPGHGARFDIYLPRVDAPPEPLPAAPALGARGGSETLLLVEDEPALRDMTREILELHGYTVIEAGSGADALDVAARHPGPIHLLLTDVVLPRMGGRQLAERLVAQRPETKVLFMSGYTDDALGRHGALDPGVVLLPKPFAPDALARAVRQALDTPGPGRGSAPPAPVGG
jgi:PAS domain S-box-containing protein